MLRIPDLPSLAKREHHDRPFLTARWHSLAMINYEIEPAALTPFVPAGTKIDAYQGRTLLTAVGFMFDDARLLGLPVPFHQSFPEVNLRFYVRRHVAGRTRRGVVFLKEIVSRRAVALLARRGFGERFVRLPVRHRFAEDQQRQGRTVEYAFRYQGRWSRLTMTATGLPARPPAGSEEAFVLDHYWAHCATRDGRCREHHVVHRPWQIQPAVAASFDGIFNEFYGPRFAAALARPPTSAFLADGSEVAVRLGKMIGRSDG